MSVAFSLIIQIVISAVSPCFTMLHLNCPGCSSSVTLTGLPTNGDAQCFLTFKVRSRILVAQRKWWNTSGAEMAWYAWYAWYDWYGRWILMDIGGYRRWDMIKNGMVLWWDETMVENWRWSNEDEDQLPSHGWTLKDIWIRIHGSRWISDMPLEFGGTGPTGPTGDYDLMHR